MNVINKVGAFFLTTSIGIDVSEWLAELQINDVLQGGVFVLGVFKAMNEFRKWRGK
jgi:hypothetical protein